MLFKDHLYSSSYWFLDMSIFWQKLYLLTYEANLFQFTKYIYVPSWPSFIPQLWWNLGVLLVMDKDIFPFL